MTNDPAKPKILYYDIETTPLKAYVWRLGDQVVRHDQLTADGGMYDIICITYCYNDGKPAKHLDWGYNKQNSKKMIEQFDKLINTADMVIGKNNKSFDDRHINTQRMLHGLPSIGDWSKKSDDLQTQMKKFFGKALPSQGLDYISKLLGVGGKIKMGLSDWVDILERRDEASFRKMIEYGKKDVEDTRAIWERVEDYILPKHLPKSAKSKFGDAGCRECGSCRVQSRGYRMQLSGKVHRGQCQDCGAWSSKPCT